MTALPSDAALLGSSELVVPVPFATPISTGLPTPPFLLQQFEPSGAGAQRVKGRLYPLPFGIGDGFQVAVRRIHLRLPVVVTEVPGGESRTVTTEDRSHYATETEAVSAFEGAGGKPTETVTVTPGTPGEPFVKTVTTYAYAHEFGNFVATTVKTTTTTSVLPASVQLLAALIGPEGAVWAQSFDVPVPWAHGSQETGNGVGQGIVDSYADLQNPLVMTPNRNIYGLALYGRIPSCGIEGPSLKIGLEVDYKGVPQNGEHSEVTLFYDIERAPVGK